MCWKSPDDLAKIVSEQSLDLLQQYGNLEGLAQLLKTDFQKGLNKEALNKYGRVDFYGDNSIPQPPVVTMTELMVETLEDKTLITLSISAAISLALGLYENPSSGWIEGVAILAAVVVVVFVTALNDYEKEKQFRKLNEKKNDIDVKVLRNQKQTEVSVYQVYVGDILVVEPGDILCADGLLITGRNLVCDQSSITGESKPIKKGKDDPFMISGSTVNEGHGKVLVLATGIHSFQGKTLLALQRKSEETPLQKKLNSLADKIAYFGMAMALLTMFCLTVRYIVNMYVQLLPFDLHFFSVLTKIIITGVTILVVAVPEFLEGLPLAVTISLAYSVMKMFNDNILVRRLEACETMGGASAICSDKTGTLTLNKMTVVKGLLGNELFDDMKQLKTVYENSFLKDLINENISCNSTVYRLEKEGKTIIAGSRTETALVNFLAELDYDFEKIREKTDILNVFPFSSKEKKMLTIIQRPRGKRIYIKGASEMVLKSCESVLTHDGKKTDIPQKWFYNEIDRMANEALRTIGLAYADVDENFDAEFEYAGPFVLLGIVGIMDPVRPEVPHAVRQCQQAGITVRLVTGDNAITARAIAQRCGIDDGLVMEGPDFEKLSEERLKEICPNLRVLSRSSPNDKLTLVRVLKELGEIVAVTGDGANDGPALSQAHVGFSMGLTGTEIAKQASAIVLLDDNFKSIVQACVWGRNVFDSIRKFLQFQLTVNIVAVSLAFIGSLSSVEGTSPLKPVQLLWVNLIMDTMAALALSTEPPSPDLLQRPPNGLNEPLITSLMWKNIIGWLYVGLRLNYLTRPGRAGSLSVIGQFLCSLLCTSCVWA
jgi:Ca2+-transporting ATPase